MIKSTIMMLLLISLTGCIIIGGSAPKDNFQFSDTSNIQQFIGVYKNVGDPNGYISRELWKGSYIVDIFGKDVAHKEIEFIEVLHIDNKLRVNAIKNDCIIYSKDYVIDQDFTITSNGRIVLKKDINLLNRGTGDPLVGPSYEKLEIGLDEKGSGKSKGQVYFAGLAFMFFPMAGGASSESKYEKIINTIPFELCKSR